jgi:hypothetical protein
MKNLKKLHVAVAVASLFAAGNSMALAISQSGVTIAREVISVATTSTQSLLAPSVSVNFINGPTANALSSQDFSVTLELASSTGAPAVWNPSSLVVGNIWRTVNAKRQSNGAITEVISSTGTPAGTVFIRVLDVQIEPGTSTAGSTVRYFFRLENLSGAAVSLSDLALEFNSVNGTTAPVGLGDYARIGALNTAVSAIIGSRVGSDNTAPGCANDDSRLTVRARNFIGSGFTAPEGESSGSIVLNNGYVLFAQALNIRIGRAETGVINIPNRNTDVSTSNTGLTTDTSGFGAANRMTMGFIKFSKVPVDAWDLSVQGNYYAYRRPGGGGTYGSFTSPVAAGSLGDLGTFATTNIVGNIDVSNVKVVIKSSNGFAAGSTFSLTNSPFGTLGGAAAPGTSTGAVGTAVFSNDPTGPVGNTNIATVTFSHANLVDAANAGAAATLLGSTGAGTTSTVFYPAITNDRFYINYITSGAAIPQSTFTGTVTLVKESDATNGTEQDNLSCVGELAGLGGGLKIDVRNFYPYNPANPGSEWVGVLRVINNSETVDADLTGQYIRADGKYGKWGSMGTLPARGARYFLSSEIYNLLNQNTNTTLPKDNSGSGGLTAEAGAGAQPPNTRLRISSASASTLRVQSYIYNGVTRALVEVSGSQGADFDTYERTTRDSIEQDAQTGIKK